MYCVLSAALHCMTWREATGVERADVSAETGEVKVRVTVGVDMDPEKLGNQEEVCEDSARRRERPIARTTTHWKAWANLYVWSDTPCKLQRAK